jgi:hypothetical protein
MNGSRNIDARGTWFVYLEFLLRICHLVVTEGNTRENLEALYFERKALNAEDSAGSHNAGVEVEVGLDKTG